MEHVPSTLVCLVDGGTRTGQKAGAVEVGRSPSDAVVERPCEPAWQALGQLLIAEMELRCQFAPHIANWALVVRGVRLQERTH